MAHFVIGWLRNTSYYLFGSGSSGLWIASTTMAARVASRRNVTRPIVVVLPFSSLLWFAGREAPGLFGFQFFPNLSFNRRIGGLAQTAQD
jgi:hypothetical protein